MEALGYVVIYNRGTKSKDDECEKVDNTYGYFSAVFPQDNGKRDDQTPLFIQDGRSHSRLEPSLLSYEGRSREEVLVWTRTQGSAQCAPVGE